MSDETTSTQTEGNNAGEAGQAENPTMEDSRTYTQEEFDSEVKSKTESAVKSRMARASSKHQKELDELSAANEQLAAKVASLEEENGKLKARSESQAWAEEISASTGVPAAVLRGETKEDMEAHAAQIAPYLTRPAPYVESDGFAAGKQQSKTTSDMFADALEGII